MHGTELIFDPRRLAAKERRPLSMVTLLPLPVAGGKRRGKGKGGDGGCRTHLSIVLVGEEKSSRMMRSRTRSLSTIL